MSNKIVFMSNFINHHQKPFCDAMHKRLGDDFVFIQTEPMEQERIDMGWSEEYVSLPYVKCIYEYEECGKKILMESPSFNFSVP